MELTESNLLQHMLVVGSTGCGKTTLLTEAIRQLIHRPERIGLLILDAKAEGLVADVIASAKAAGRPNDVIVFGADGNATYDVFDGLQSLDQVDRITRRLMLGVERFNADNAFWAQATTGMIGAALVLLHHLDASSDFPRVVNFMRQWFLSEHTPPPVNAALQRMQLSAVSHPLNDAAADQVRLWETLDPRTKTNVQACLLQVLRPLMGAQAVACFHSGNGPALSPALGVSVGRICVVSLSALAEPDLARFLFRVAKAEFFETVQRRGRGSHRLCGVLADELPLVLTIGDVANAGTIRSKFCFFLAATQGLDGIVQQLGPVAGRTLISHFNTVVLMRCREMETATYALVALGNRRQQAPRQRPEAWQDLMEQRPMREFDVPVCPLGALGQLAPHQAYVIFADGRRTIEPLWLVPWFELMPQPLPVPDAPTPPAFPARRMLELMLATGCKLHWPANVILGVAALNRQRRHRKTLKQVNAFFLKRSFLIPEGLEALPEQWLVALPGILKRWAPRLRMRERFNIAELAQTSLGGRVICEERDLLYEEAPAAYKNIEAVVQDLVDAGLVSVIATLRPLLTYKTRKQRR